MLFRDLASSSVVALSLATGGCAGAAVDGAELSSAEVSGADRLARDYRGTVAGLDVMLRIAPKGSSFTGTYFYVGKVTKGETIAIHGDLAGSGFSAVESVDGTKTGSFSGVLASNGSVRGTWTSPKGTRHPFALEPVKTPTVITRVMRDSASVADPSEPFPTCHVDVTYLDVFGLSDASSEAELDERLAMDAIPLEKNPQGKCDYWNSFDSTSTVKLNEKGLLVVETSSEADGGAHPSYSLSWVNASTKTGKVLNLTDVVKADKMMALKATVKAVYEAREDGVDDFLLETVERAFESPSSVSFELTKQGLRISMFDALPHAAQAEDGDGALVKWDALADMVIPTSEAAVLLH